MKKFRIAALAGLLLLAACGQRGPLYLPHSGFEATPGAAPLIGVKSTLNQH